MGADWTIIPSIPCVGRLQWECLFVTKCFAGFQNAAGMVILDLVLPNLFSNIPLGLTKIAKLVSRSALQRPHTEWIPTNAMNATFNSLSVYMRNAQHQTNHVTWHYQRFDFWIFNSHQFNIPLSVVHNINPQYIAVCDSLKGSPGLKICKDKYHIGLKCSVEKSVKTL